MGELKKVFRPEFLNRIDDVIVFHKLTKDEIKTIVDLLLRRIRASLAERDLQLELTEGAEDFLVEKGWDPAMGARPLRRAIQRYIEDPLADFVLRAELDAGGTVMVEPAPEGSDEDVSSRSSSPTRSRPRWASARARRATRPTRASTTRRAGPAGGPGAAGRRVALRRRTRCPRGRPRGRPRSSLRPRFVALARPTVRPASPASSRRKTPSSVALPAACEPFADGEDGDRERDRRPASSATWWSTRPVPGAPAALEVRRASRAAARVRCPSAATATTVRSSRSAVGAVARRAAARRCAGRSASGRAR